MIECPDCGKSIKGYRCSCGYKIPKISSINERPFIHRDYARDEDLHLQECRLWLLSKGIVNQGMTQAERQMAMAAYRNKIKKDQVPDPLDWARSILLRLEDGEFILPIQEHMAKSALGIS